MAGYTVIIPNAFQMSGNSLKDTVPSVSADPIQGNYDFPKFGVSKTTAYHPLLNPTSPGYAAAKGNAKSAFYDPNHATITFNFGTGGKSGDYVGRYVRRPMSGIAIKPNTHATISVLNGATGGVVKVFNELGSSSIRHTGDMVKIEADSQGNLKAPEIEPNSVDRPQSRGWTDWFLQSVVESRQEKVQITETFDHTIFSAYGEKPRFLVFQGFLMNTADFPWRAEFWHNWDNYFRATKLIEEGNRIQLHWDDIVVQGYPLNATAKQNAKNPNMIGFQFSLFVTSYMNLSMENVGYLQSMQTQALPVNLKSEDLLSKTYMTRSAEFVGDNAFSYQARPSHRTAIIKALGGENLAYLEFLKDIGWGSTEHWTGKQSASPFPLGGGPYGAALGNSSSLYAGLMGARARYIKGGKTAREFIVNYVNTVSRQWGQAALNYGFQAASDATAKTQTGSITATGSLGLGEKIFNFWTGQMAQLYDSVIFSIMNSVVKGGSYNILKNANGDTLRTVTGALIYSAGYDTGPAGYAQEGTKDANYASKHLLLSESARWETPTTDIDNVHQINKWAKWGTLMLKSGNTKQIVDQLAYGTSTLVWHAMFDTSDTNLYDASLVRVPGLEHAASTQVGAGTVDLTKKISAIVYNNKAAMASGKYSSSMAHLIYAQDEEGNYTVGGPSVTGPDSGYGVMSDFTSKGASKDIPWWKDAASEQYVFNPQAVDEDGNPIPDGAWEYSKDWTGGAAGQPAVALTEDEKVAADLAYQAAVLKQSQEAKGQYKGKANHTVGAKLDDDEVEDDGADPMEEWEDLEYGPGGDFPGWEFQTNDEEDD